MSIVAIDGVRWTNDRVTHVRWGNIDELTANWTSVPKVVDVDRVVKVLEKGELVRTVFKLGGEAIWAPRSAPSLTLTGTLALKPLLKRVGLKNT